MNERLAAFQELERRGKLNDEQTAALRELERRLGSGRQTKKEPEQYAEPKVKTPEEPTVGGMLMEKAGGMLGEAVTDYASQHPIQAAAAGALGLGAYGIGKAVGAGGKEIKPYFDTAANKLQNVEAPTGTPKTLKTVFEGAADVGGIGVGMVGENIPTDAVGGAAFALNFVPGVGPLMSKGLKAGTGAIESVASKIPIVKYAAKPLERVLPELLTKENVLKYPGVKMILDSIEGSRAVKKTVGKARILLQELTEKTAQSKLHGGAIQESLEKTVPEAGLRVQVGNAVQSAFRAAKNRSSAKITPLRKDLDNAANASIDLMDPETQLAKLKEVTTEVIDLLPEPTVEKGQAKTLSVAGRIKKLFSPQTKKNPSGLLDAQGNPMPDIVTPPPAVEVKELIGLYKQLGKMAEVERVRNGGRSNEISYIYGRLREAISDDLDNYVTTPGADTSLVDKWSKYRKVARAHYDVYDNDLVRQVMDGNPSELTDHLISSPESAEALKRAVGPKAFGRMVNQKVGEIYLDLKNHIASGKDAAAKFDGIVKGYGGMDNMRRIFGNQADDLWQYVEMDKELKGLQTALDETVAKLPESQARRFSDNVSKGFVNERRGDPKQSTLSKIAQRYAGAAMGLGTGGALYLLNQHPWVVAVGAAMGVSPYIVAKMYMKQRLSRFPVTNLVSLIGTSKEAQAAQQVASYMIANGLLPKDHKLPNVKTNLSNLMPKREEKKETSVPPQEPTPEIPTASEDYVDLQQARLDERNAKRSEENNRKIDAFLAESAAAQEAYKDYPGYVPGGRSVEHTHQYLMLPFLRKKYPGVPDEQFRTREYYQKALNDPDFPTNKVSAVRRKFFPPEKKKPSSR